MIQIDGKYNSAIVYADNIDPAAREQLETLCGQAFVTGSKIRIMPDVHVGAGCTIGTTMTIEDKAIPNLVGVDIGCGMEVMKIENRHLELEKLDKLIHGKIPSGFNIRKSEHFLMEELDLGQLNCANEVNVHRAKRSMGTLGGGNHFIEVNGDSSGNLFLVIHSGSRHLGLEVATLYQEEAYKRLNKNSKKDMEALISEYKGGSREKELQKEIRKRMSDVLTDIPPAFAYVSGTLFNEYVHDMKIVQEFAELNRKAMAHEIVKGMDLRVEYRFATIHNYIDTENMILRKGAVSAREGELLLIPINMRDGSLVCKGKGNPEWNESAPHGAGRLMSRKKARKTLSMAQYKETMEGIYSTSVNSETLDECPLAYKPMEEIISGIGETVEILETIKPVYNFKAGE
jgi:RNA-splicing ligase RtcB